jgi:hypothetical protein
MENLRQALNEEIQFNLKDLYVAVCCTSSSANFNHFLSLIKNMIPLTNFDGIESFIRFYNGNSSLRYFYIKFSLTFI